MKKHPYIETAEIKEELLRAQRWHDKRCDGVAIFKTEEAERQYRDDIRELRKLARVDRDNGWPFDD